jgi:hypothetical protein
MGPLRRGEAGTIRPEGARAGSVRVFVSTWTYCRKPRPRLTDPGGQDARKGAPAGAKRELSTRSVEPRSASPWMGWQVEDSWTTAGLDLDSPRAANKSDSAVAEADETSRQRCRWRGNRSVDQSKIKMDPSSAAGRPVPGSSPGQALSLSKGLNDERRATTKARARARARATVGARARLHAPAPITTRDRRCDRRIAARPRPASNAHKSLIPVRRSFDCPNQLPSQLVAVIDNSRIAKRITPGLEFHAPPYGSGA